MAFQCFFFKWQLDQSKLWVLIFTQWIPIVFDLLKWHVKAVVSNHDCNFSIRTQCRKWIFSFFLHCGLSVSSVRYYACLRDVSSVSIREEEGQRKQLFPPQCFCSPITLCYYPRFLSFLHFVFSFTCRLQCVKSSKVVPVAMDHATKAYRWHESKINLGMRSRQIVNFMLWSLYIQGSVPHIHKTGPHM